ncbi:retropepsin-like aspartic protease [Brytella acorum]|uniref:Retropepsin-like aspartic protease n=1 Tax=Brytella acorum TaxID=2959299 RepID=A0AA35V3W9_9PROT|nr:retropepsin-like aspartic protease [Brytella acorum]MDF3625603.1 retropepsin-like aspartic protease [Brytella acorum]CAI9119468.1 retropepsin-like aspartic protease [Brytella acorum]
MRRRAGVLAALMALGSHVARAESCHVAPVLEVSIRSDSLFLNAPVRLDGHAGRMLVDTGSEGSLVTPETQKRLDLRADPRIMTVMRGANGRGTLSPVVVVRSLRLGGFELGPRPMPLGALPGVPDDLEPPIMGLMGADLWRGYDLEIDVPHGRLVFWAVGGGACRNVPSWPAPFETLPAALDRGRLTVPFRLDGVAGRALVDSGARSHVVSRAFARRTGVDDAVLARDPGGISSGVDMNAKRYVWHRFHLLSLGEGHEESGAGLWREPVLTVSDVQDGADMLMGADWFARHDVWLSYATRQVFFRSVAPGRR